MTRVLCALAAALALAEPAAAARFAVGLSRGASAAAVASRVEALTGGSVSSLAPLRALLVDAPSPAGVSALPGVAYVDPLRPRRVAFAPSDPLAGRQWYLDADHAFDLWNLPPSLPPVKVAVIDSGIDLGHPEFAGRIAAVRSFVGGSIQDTEGHGTFVAGEIAAGLDNGIGIAGIAFSAQLLVAKVVRPDGTVSPEAEAEALRWAVDSGARVINLSLGGVRDPGDPEVDTYSPLEQSAIDYAFSHGAVLVAAVGNGDQAPSQPWPYASYPAALPHVIGVSALAQDGSVPAFSNRDATYDDVAAPGVGMFSTMARSLTAEHPACVDQGYSDCGPFDFRDAEGTSFAAPQVSAAAALLIAERPRLTPDQVSYILERSAVDENASTGCRACPLQRDSLTGWGRLDIAAALQALDGPLPPRDRYETNDDVDQAYPLWGRRRLVDATIDYWDDPIDVYAVRLRRGQTVSLSLKGPARSDLRLALWAPGSTTVKALASPQVAGRVAVSVTPGSKQHFIYRAKRTGDYYVEVRIAAAGFGAYALRVLKS